MGFAVAPRDVESDEAAGIVVAQNPGRNELVPVGSTVTLSVSEGPSATAVADVTNQEVDTAKTTLKASGFEIKVVFTGTDDPSLDGVVISQDPAGGTGAKPSTVVTLVVGQFLMTTG